MGNSFASRAINPLNPVPPGLGGDKGGSVPFTPPKAPPLVTGANTSGLFDPYAHYIPEAMNSNTAIKDPTSILRAYAANLPEFMRASGAITTAPEKGASLSERKSKK